MSDEDYVHTYKKKITCFYWLLLLKLDVKHDQTYIIYLSMID